MDSTFHVLPYMFATEFHVTSKCLFSQKLTQWANTVEFRAATTVRVLHLTFVQEVYDAPNNYG